MQHSGWKCFIVAATLLAVTSAQATEVADGGRELRFSEKGFDVPLTFSKTNKPCIEIVAGEAKLKVVFDTGSKGLFLRTGALKDAQRVVVGKDKSVSYGKETEAARILVPSLRFADMTLKEVPGTERSSETDTLDGVDGQIGLDFFREIDFVIDPIRKRLFSAGAAEPGSEWKSVSLTVLSDEHNRYYFGTLKAPGGKEGLVYLDSGANCSFIDTELARTLAGKDQGKNLDVTGWLLGEHRLKTFSFALFGRVNFKDKADVISAGVLGADFFSSRAVRFSVKSKKAWIKDE